MNLEQNLSYITKELDIIFDKYSKQLGFNHPIFEQLSPRKQEWGHKFIGNVYRWCLRYETGDTRDTSAALVMYMPDEKECYQIICGKPREPICVNKKTSNLNEILDVFENVIVENIICERP